MVAAKPYYVIGSILAIYCFTYTFSGLKQHSRGHHHHSGMDHSSHSDMGHDMPMMPMWFQFSLDTYLWLESLHPTSPLGYAASLLLLVAFAIGHEALASHRVSYLKSVSQGSPQQQQGYVPVPAERSKESASQWRYRCTNSSLYAANMATSFLLMLAVMTYNAGYFLAVVVGLGLGHFFCFKQPQHFRVDTCCETAVGAAEF